MRTPLGRLASLVILLSTVQPATAGDFGSGLWAYNRGDYITAFRDWYPLTEHGDTRAQAGLGFLFHKGLGIISPLVDNLNASIRLRALLTDIFLNRRSAEAWQGLRCFQAAFSPPDPRRGPPEM